MLKDELNKFFTETKANAFISESPQTRLWFANVQTSDGYLIIEPNKAYLFVDGRYIEYATKNAKNVDIKLLEKGTLSEFLKKKNYKLVAVEKDYLKLGTFESFKEIFFE